MYPRDGISRSASQTDDRFFLSYYSLKWGFTAVSGRDGPTHAADSGRSPFLHLCTEELSRTCCAGSRGGSLLSPLPHATLPFGPPYNDKAENDIS